LTQWFLQRIVHLENNIMEYVPLGNTGLKVSRICLGCMSYGSSKWRDWVLEESQAILFFRQEAPRVGVQLCCFVSSPLAGTAENGFDNGTRGKKDPGPRFSQQVLNRFSEKMSELGFSSGLQKNVGSWK
jgi:hypothetical protein